MVYPRLESEGLKLGEPMVYTPQTLSLKAENQCPNSNTVGQWGQIFPSSAFLFSLTFNELDKAAPQGGQSALLSLLIQM